MFSNCYLIKTRMFGLALVLAAVLMLSLPAGSIQAQSGGGFEGPGPDLVTVSQALKMKDDSRVSLKGNIIKNLGDESYQFKDATGTIEVEIDGEVWRGLTVQPEDVVIISGEVDKDWNHTSIDVSSITKQ